MAENPRSTDPKPDPVKVEDTPPVQSEPAPPEGAVESITAAPEVVETVEWPNWGPPPPADDEVISLSGLQLAEYEGENPRTPAAADTLARFEQYLRDNKIVKTTKKDGNAEPEGFYGEQTRGLVNQAYAQLLDRKVTNGVVGPDLIEALRQHGAVVGV